MMLSLHSRARWLSLLGVGALLAGTSAFGGSWTATPQPLVGGAPGHREIITADEGSSLLIDPTWRNVWQVSYGALKTWFWNGRYFQSENPTGDAAVAVGSVLAMDEGYHQVFFVSRSNKLCVCHRGKNSWGVDAVSSESITAVLGVDQAWHMIYAYDAGRRSVIAVHWDAKSHTWISTVAATNLGSITNAGAVDGNWHILYSVHEDAPDLGVPTSDSPFFKPWALVATWWDGKQFHSQAVDQTGVPQVPAVRAPYHQVYYTRSNELKQTQWSQPKQKPSANNFVFASGMETNWQGADTFVDDSSYPVNLDPVNYYGSWFSSVYDSSVTMTVGGRYYDTGWFNDTYHPKPPFRLADATVPVWETTAIPERIVEVSAAASVLRGELAQQRASNQAGTGYSATGWSHVDHVYADARGAYFKLGAGATSELSYGLATSIASTPTTISIDGQTFYDPLSVPTSAGSLSPRPLVTIGPPAADRVVTGAYFTIPKTMAGTLQSVLANADAVEGTTSPQPSPRLVVNGAKLTTFGHPVSNHKGIALSGGRYQTYTSADYQGAMAGGIACDSRSKLVLYTQAPPAGVQPYTTNQVWVVAVY